MAQTKPGMDKNQRVKLKYEVPGRASLALPIAAITPKLLCPAQGAAMPRAATAPSLQEGEENKTKQAWK